MVISLDNVLVLADGTFRYSPDANKESSDLICICGVCGTSIVGQIGVCGSRSYSESMRNVTSTYDLWMCPYAETNAHKLIRELIKYKLTLPLMANNLRKLIDEDIVQALCSFRANL